MQKLNNSYFLKKGVGLSIARAGNVIGGGDWSKDRLIPDCAKSWKSKKPVILRNPNSTRPWQNVLDVIRGYSILAAKLSQNKKLLKNIDVSINSILSGFLIIFVVSALFAYSSTLKKKRIEKKIVFFIIS